MNRPLQTMWLVGALAIAAAATGADFLDDPEPLVPIDEQNLSEEPDAFHKQPTLKPPAEADVRAQALAWLESAGAAEPVRQQAAAAWPAPAPENPPAASTGPELLDRLAATLALGDARIRDLVDLCAKPPQQLTPPSQEWLADEKLAPLVRNNLRLLYGRWLSRERFYEESLEQLASLEAADVVDPAALLFYQGVDCHRLLQKESGVKAIRRLLDDVAGSPVRYTSVAGLMLADLEDLEQDSLDEISRMMDDINRRLDLGRAGPKVRKVEDDVIAKLDKIIEEIEKQQQQQQASAGGNTLQPTQPAQDSVPMTGKGPGQTNKRNIGSKAGWGDLPDKQRQEAMQQIGKDFPSHYREVIEQYFRKIASDERGNE